MGKVIAFRDKLLRRHDFASFLQVSHAILTHDRAVFVLVT